MWVHFEGDSVAKSIHDVPKEVEVGTKIGDNGGSIGFNGGVCGFRFRFGNEGDRDVAFDVKT